MKPTYEELKAQNEELKRLLKIALDRITELERKLGLNSNNSSKPPSTDQKKNTPGKEGKKKPSREGKSRAPYPPERVNHHIECSRTHCPHCNQNALQQLQEAPFSWQQVELPEACAIVTQFNCLKYRCGACGLRSTGQLPAGVPFSAFGPRVMALVASLTGRFHLAKREAILLIKDLYGIDLSEGSVINMEENVADALEEVHERIHRFVVEGSITRYFDETTWRDSGKRHYVWLGTTEVAAYYRIDPGRSQAAFLKLIGTATRAPSVSDRYNAYTILDGPHQYCLAHLIRDFHAFAEKRGEDGRVGALIEGELRGICRTHTSWKQGDLSRQQRGSRLSHSRRRLDDLLIEGMAWGSDALYGLCERLADQYDHLFAFASVEGMDPTNNMAERDLRKLVLWRKKSYGTRSSRGQRFVERISGVTETLKKNGGNVLQFLEESMRAFYRSEPAPFISPALGF